MNMPYHAKAIANYFLEYAWERNKDLNPMKIQKLTYFSHGWYLAIEDEPLISQAIEAWDYGPVIPTLYHEFKEYGSGPIRDLATSIAITSRKPLKFHYDAPQIEDSPSSLADTKELLDRIWEVYGDFTAIQLSSLTHREGTPWDKTRKRFPNKRGVDIPDKWIKSYFLKLADKDE